MGSVTLAELLEKDASGNDCITLDTLDLIWPRDPDVVPLEVAGKGVKLPPTCTSFFVPCEEKHGRDACIQFVFNGGDIPPPKVPLGAPGLFLASALVMVAVFKIRNRKSKSF